MTKQFFKYMIIALVSASLTMLYFYVTKHDVPEIPKQSQLPDAREQEILR